MTTAHLLPDLRLDEGLRLHAYPDPLSGGDPWTIGYGHTGREVHKGLTITIEKAEADLEADVALAEARCDDHIPWWRSLDDVRQDVCVMLMLNMGWLSPDGKHGLGTFHHTLAAIAAHNWQLAYTGLLTSAWAKQVHGRAIRLAEQMRTGVHA